MPFVFNPFTGNLDSVQSLTFPGTLVVASGKTATINNTLTFSGTDASSVAFGAGGTVLYTSGSGAALTFPGTLVIASGKTATVNNTLTLVGTDATTMTLPTTSATVARTDAANDFALVTTTATSGTVTGQTHSGTANPSSTSTLVYRPFTITPTINYSAGTPGAGSYEALKIAVTETALPTGTNYLIRASAGTAGATDIFSVTNAGLISFSSSGHTIKNNGSNSVEIRPGGAAALQINGGASGVSAFSGQLAIGAIAADTILVRDAANILSLRNSTTAQTLRVYETYTDASNYSRLSISAPSGGPITFASEAAGTGTARTFSFNNSINLSASNSTLNVSGGISSYVQSYMFLSPSSSFRLREVSSVGQLKLNASGSVQWANDGDSNSTADVIVSRATAAAIQLGVDVNGAATAQTLQAANAITGSNLAGGNLTLRPGTGMGTGTVSSLIVQTPTIAASGANTQAQATRVTISSASLNATVPVAFGGNLAISNAVPTISSGFGSGATIAGIAGGFRVTCGTTPGTGGTVAFNTTYANAPVCFVQDETTGVLGIAAPTTTTVVVSGLTLLSGQTIAVLVFGY